VASHFGAYRWMRRLGGGECREENRPMVELTENGRFGRIPGERGNGVWVGRLERRRGNWSVKRTDQSEKNRPTG
jgi:hypothetical protein